MAQIGKTPEPWAVFERWMMGIRVTGILEMKSSIGLGQMVGYHFLWSWASEPLTTSSPSPSLGGEDSGRASEDVAMHFLISF